MTINLLLTSYALLSIYFMHSIGVNRTVRNIIAIILGILVGDLYRD